MPLTMLNNNEYSLQQLIQVMIVIGKIKMICRRFSTIPFYKIKQESLLPEIPQDMILSKYLSKEINFQKQKQQRKQENTKASYSKYLKGNPYGSILNIKHKEIQITLLSTNYHRVSPISLTQALMKTNPDAILVQSKPEKYKKQLFNYLPKNKQGVFSDLGYLKQILLNPLQVPQLNAINKYFSNIIKNRRISRNPAIDPQISKMQEGQIMGGVGLSGALYYSHDYQKDLYFGQMPQRTLRQWIVNSNTLYQLTQIFKNVCVNLPKYKNVKLTIYQLATILNPDIFLSYNDVYMGTLIEMLIATGKYKRIMGIMGIMQNQAVASCLSRDCTNPIINLLIPQPPKSSILSNLQPLEIIEKHILLDIMNYGEDVIDIPISNFESTNQIIQFYLKENFDSENMLKFRYHVTNKYLNIFMNKYKEGSQIINKQHVRQVIRNRSLNKS